MNIIAWPVVVALLLVGSVARAEPAPVHGHGETLHFNIPAMPLNKALSAFARASRAQILFAPALVAGKQSTAINGDFAPEEALHRLLAHARLDFSRDSNGIITLRAITPRIVERPVAPPDIRPHPPDPRPPGMGRLSDLRISDIIVTATRHANRLQSVPTTITAISDQTLHAFNMTDTLDLPSLIPGMIAVAQGGNNLFIRGIGSSSTGYNEAQVAVYLDGVYLANPAMSAIPFNDTERVEVLKGPQGTLYGRNAVGGLIAITSRSPGDHAQMDATVGLGNYDTTSARLFLTTPLTDTLGVSVALVHQGQGRGWSTNLQTGNTEQRVKESGVHARLVWRPASDTTVSLAFAATTSDRDIGYAYEVYPGTLGTDGTPYLGAYILKSRIDPSAPFAGYLGSLKVEHELGAVTLTSLSAYQGSHQTVTFAGSNPTLGQPLAGQDVVYDRFFESNRTFSQEIQLSSHPPSGRWEWVLGAYLYDDVTRLTLDTFDICIASVCGPGFVPSRNAGVPSTRSYSLFGDGTYALTPTTRLTLGMRYTNETKDLSGQQSPLAGYPNSVTDFPAGTVLYPGQPFSGFPAGIPTRLNFQPVTYRVALAHDVGANLHGYVTYGLGFKSGTFNANVFTNPPAEPELLHATEVGIKSDLLDRRLRLNIAYFHYDYKDVQVRSAAPPALPGTNILQNAAKVRGDGVDLDLSAIPAPGLRLDGGLEWLDARYVDYPGATCVAPALTTDNGLTLGAPISTTCNLAGRRPMNAPPLSASLQASYQVETRWGAFSWHVNTRFVARFPLDNSDLLYQDSYAQLDLSLGWRSLRRTLEIQLWARNLTAAQVWSFGQINRNFLVVPAAPRTFGANVGLHF